MEQKEALAFANEWVNAWNSCDLDRILTHYSDDIEVSTPMIKMAADMEGNSLKGKKAVAEYWETALRKLPALEFKLYDVAVGSNSVALYYEAVMGKKAIEVMFLNEQGKIEKMIAHYT
ncbi:hypothetical protein FUAX_39280 (plasmid) [Fulvitalea axinellae]|uniref:SnoaL-like domain-containing protein n=1 Tax=Fulvitalea axinellae TaxID=1182444 RepID=A0AAU9CH48_9BACT|nr:hypothetical protein FUAX_39280 [Fulvitalea axinellae]